MFTFFCLRCSFRWLAGFSNTLFLRLLFVSCFVVCLFSWCFVLLVVFVLLCFFSYRMFTLFYGGFFFFFLSCAVLLFFFLFFVLPSCSVVFFRILSGFFIGVLVFIFGSMSFSWLLTHAVLVFRIFLCVWLVLLFLFFLSFSGISSVFPGFFFLRLLSFFVCCYVSFRFCFVVIPTLGFFFAYWLFFVFCLYCPLSFFYCPGSLLPCSLSCRVHLCFILSF